MNLTLTSQWAIHNNRTYLIVTISAETDIAEATASQTYLDIRMPDGARIRHIGSLPGDGQGNTIGVDVPDIHAGEHQNIVFKVKGRANGKNAMTPELHLHWIDSASGDLLERHQTGVSMPSEPTEPDDTLTNIVATARSEQKATRRNTRRHKSTKENNSMNTEHETQTQRSRRCDHRGNREAFVADGEREFGEHRRGRWNREQSEDTTEIVRRPRHGHRGRAAMLQSESDSEYGRRGRHAGRHARGAWENTHSEHRHGESHRGRAAKHQIQHMQEQIDELERHMRRLQRKMKHALMEEQTEVHKIVRTRREPGSHRDHRAHGYGRKMRGAGRRMGSMALGTVGASRHTRDEKQLARADRQPEA